jgi:DNA-binding GntR family transcriptional regulator
MLDNMTQSDRVFGLLEAEIVSGRLPMGAKLGEEVLAARLGVSRGPLREALRRLEGRSLVERTAHAGARVVNLSEAAQMELYEVRSALEGLAARLAAERASDAELAAIADLLARQKVRSAKNDDTEYSQGVERDDFHYRLAMASGSERLQRLLCGDLYSLMRLCRYKTWSIPGQRKSHQDHERILEAIQNRDGELAELLMRRHVWIARKRFIVAGTGGDPEL